MKKPEEFYGAIQSQFRNGGFRTFYPTQAAATKKAQRLITGEDNIHGYKPMPLLLIVKVVGVVEVNAKPRKLKRGELIVGEVE